MCGNAARCLIAFARKLGIEKDKYSFETKERILKAHYIENEIEVDMGPPEDMRKEIEVSAKGNKWKVNFVNTGVPHAVIFVDDVNEVDVVGGNDKGRRGLAPLLRGMEQVLRAIEDIRRGYELGCRGFLVYDEGMLWVVNEMRKAGELPKEIVYKCSAHLGHCNPASFKLLENLLP
jgi:hypothetical protein